MSALARGACKTTSTATARYAFNTTALLRCGPLDDKPQSLDHQQSVEAAGQGAEDKYTDPAGSADGITKVLLKGSTQDKAKCLVKGKGANLDDLDLTTLVEPVTVQLVNSATSACFETTFDQADFDHST